MNTIVPCAQFMNFFIAMPMTYDRFYSHQMSAFNPIFFANLRGLIFECVLQSKQWNKNQSFKADGFKN